MMYGTKLTALFCVPILIMRICKDEKMEFSFSAFVLSKRIEKRDSLTFRLTSVMGKLKSSERGKCVEFDIPVMEIYQIQKIDGANTIE